MINKLCAVAHGYNCYICIPVKKQNKFMRALSDRVIQSKLY